MSRVAAVVGPSDDGRRMTLAEFDVAEAVEGRFYELSRGVIVVTDVPNPPHGDVVYELRQQLAAFDLGHRGIIHRVHTGSECKILIEATESERHPDLAIYKTTPPADDSSVWSIWIPEIVVEVVSPDSAHRDYVEKAEDYLHFGVQEYWIIDSIAGKVTIHRRSRGQWQIQQLTAGSPYATHLLPGFTLDVASVLHG